MCSDAVTKSSSGFFSGSLFEMPLPSSQQMPAPPRQHGMGMPPPASLFSNASQNGSLHAVGSDRQSSGPGNNDWLQVHKARVFDKRIVVALFHLCHCFKSAG